MLFLSFVIFLYIFFASEVGFPICPEIFYTLYFITMILQCIRIIVGDAGLEPGTSAKEVWCATNEPPKDIKNLTQWQVIMISIQDNKLFIHPHMIL